MSRHGIRIVVVGCVISMGCSDQRPMGSSVSDKPDFMVENYDGDAGDLPPGVVLHKGRDGVNRKPRVIDDSREIQRIREMFEKELDQAYGETFNRIATGESVYSEHRFVLKHRRSRAISDLTKLMGDAGQFPKVRTEAAECLFELDEEASTRFFFDSLKSNDASLRLAALKSLGSWWRIRIDFTKSDRINQLLSLLADENEDVVKAVARLCAYPPIPEAEEKLISLLENPSRGKQASIAESLAAIATTRRAVDAILLHVLQEEKDSFPQPRQWKYRNLLQNPNPAISEPIRKSLHKYTLRFEKQRYDQNLVQDLAITADAESIPILDDIYKNARDSVSRSYAIEALARLQPDKAVDLLIDFIRREGVRGYHFRKLHPFASEADFDRIESLLLTVKKEEGPSWDTDIARLMVDKLGANGRKFVEGHFSSFDGLACSWATWKLRGIELPAVLADLKSAGIIQRTPEEILEQLQDKEHAGNRIGPFDPSDPRELPSALDCAGIMTIFDAEPNVIPAPHHHLISDFTDSTGGRFTPQCVVQTWHRRNKDDDEAPYTVQFVYQNWLFQTCAEYYGDWYDVNAVQQLLNFALEKTGHKERFITFDNDGQVAFFVFAEPKAFLPIAKKYSLALSEDSTNAMREGLEYERKVLKELAK